MVKIPGNKIEPRGPGSTGTNISAKGNLKLISHPTCKVCQSVHRHDIDMLLARGFSCRAIEKQLAELGEIVGYKSINRHSQKHMSLDLALFKNMAEQRVTEINKQVAEGSFRIISDLAILDLIIQKGVDGLLYDKVIIEAKDMIQAAKLRNEIEKSGLNAVEEEMSRQLNAIIQAVQEECPEDMWMAIVKRAKEIAQGDLFDQVKIPILEGKELIEEMITIDSGLEDDTEDIEDVSSDETEDEDGQSPS